MSAFGNILECKILRDPQSGLSKGYGIVYFDNFESSDKCIESLNGKIFAD